MKKRTPGRLIVVSACTVLALMVGWIFSPAGGAQVHEPFFLHVEGNVSCRIAPTGEWKAASKGLRLSEGSEIQTGAESSCEVAFDPDVSNVLKVRSDSHAAIESLDPPSVRLRKGSLFALIEGLEPGSTFRVLSPLATATARGTGWLQDALGHFACFLDMIYLEATKGGSLELGGGKSVDVSQDGRFGDLYDILQEELDEWLEWLESLRERGYLGGRLTEILEEFEEYMHEFFNGKYGTREVLDRDALDELLEGDGGGQRGSKP